MKLTRIGNCKLLEFYTGCIVIVYYEHLRRELKFKNLMPFLTTDDRELGLEKPHRPSISKGLKHKNKLDSNNALRKLVILLITFTIAVI